MPDFFFPNQTFYADVTALGIAGTATVFTAAANARGAWLISIASRSSYAVGAAGFPGFWMRAVAPTLIGDLGLLVIATIAERVNATDALTIYTSMLIPQFVPAGLGFFVANFAAAETTGIHHARYTLL